MTPYRYRPRTWFHRTTAKSENARTLDSAPKKPLKLELGFGEVTSLSVHPDGKRIAFSASRPSQNELHVLQNFLPPAR